METQITGERAVLINAKLYEARNEAKRLLGAKYAEDMAGGRKLIEAVMARNKCAAMPAALLLATEAKRDLGSAAAFAILVILASVVEMLEPSQP